QARIGFTASHERLQEIKFRSSKKATVDTIDALLRSVSTDAYVKEVFIDVDDLLEKHHLASTDFRQGVRLLEEMGAVKYTPQSRPKAGSTFYTLQLLGERVPNKALSISKFAIEMRLKRALEK